MIDHLAYVIKIAFGIVGAYQLFKLRYSGIFFLAIPCFMTGVELITYSSTPWHDFLNLKADPKDYEKGLVGGAFAVGMLFLFFFKLASSHKN